MLGITLSLLDSQDGIYIPGAGTEQTHPVPRQDQPSPANRALRSRSSRVM
jgi:hypothetical protein